VGWGLIKWNILALLDYQKNKAKYIKRARQRIHTVVTWLNEYKRQAGCKVCGEDHPPCLEFHHKNPKKKEAAVADLAKTASIDRIKKELIKCTVLCANCHRKVHYPIGTWED